MDWNEVRRTWLEGEPEAVRGAALSMLSRMSGCNDPGCHACRANQRQVEEFIRVVREEK